MTFRSFSLASAFVLAATLVAQAADITGKWTAQVPGRDGQTREQTFTFKVEGEKLTGETSSERTGKSELKDGRVEGNKVSFNVTINFQGNDVRINYTGTVAGDEIRFRAEAAEGGSFHAGSYREG